jgi:hypothetical protein
MKFEDFELRRNERASMRHNLIGFAKDFPIVNMNNLKLLAAVTFKLSLRHDELNRHLSVIS